jgi:hypothetical protein
LLPMAVIGMALVYLWLASYVTKAKPHTQVYTPVPALPRCGFADASWAEPPSTWRPSISQDKGLLRVPAFILLIRPGELAVSLSPMQDLSGDYDKARHAEKRRRGRAMAISFRPQIY